jgi:abortive infection bacteriophage resistance protein
MPFAAAAYNKAFLSIREQRELLASRGMRIDDAAEAECYLRHEGYYRLTAYFHPFRKIAPNGGRLDEFAPEARFSDVIRLYEFDKRLRTLMLAALRSIEISVRVAVAHHLGERDIFAHENPAMLKRGFVNHESSWRGKSLYQAWLDKYHLLLGRDDQEDFVRLFIGKYGRKIPIWVAIELWDFGLLSRFYGGMKFPDQQAVSRLYGVEDPNLFESWLRSFNYVRNVCAHHSRLWNRHIAEQPRLTQGRPIALLRHLTARGVKAPAARPYTVIALAAFVLRAMNHAGDWRGEFAGLFEKFPASPPCATADMMGLPVEWRELPLWGEEWAAAA